MRIFVAIELPDVVCDELVALQNRFALGRLVPEENFHLTLCFLGDQPDEAVEEAHLALSATHAPSFDLQLIGVGTFGRSAPLVVYATVVQSKALLALEQRITRSLRRAGLQFQKRRFRPHVTISRLPKSLSGFEMSDMEKRVADISTFQSSHFEVTTFQLYQSTLRPNGAVHELLASYQLR